MECNEFRKVEGKELDNKRDEKCKNQDVPEYLHRNKRPIINKNKIKAWHKFFRLESNEHPLIPDSSFNALSCNWSKLIKNRDILKVKPEVGSSFRFCFVKAINDFKIEEFVEDADYGGFHVLKCYIVHEPEACDYSHVVICIKHEIYKNRSAKDSYYCEIYTHQEWMEKKCLLKKRQGRPFKELRKTYRLKMLQTFSHSKKDLATTSQISNFLKLFKN